MEPISHFLKLCSFAEGSKHCETIGLKRGDNETSWLPVLCVYLEISQNNNKKKAFSSF